MNYVRPALMGGYKRDLEPQDLVAAFRSRFGEPSSDVNADQKALNSGERTSDRRLDSSRTVRWSSPSCALMAEVEVGWRSESFLGDAEVIPLLTASIIASGWGGERGAAAAKKIKF